MCAKSLRILLFTTLILAISSALGSWHLENSWKNIHLRTLAQEEEQLKGGEGCQQLMDIEFSPSHPNFVYLTTDTSQVWKSTNTGSRWVPKPTGLSCNGGLSLIVNKTDPNNVILAGFSPDGKGGAGIYKTNNGGEKWDKVYENVGYMKTSLVRGQNLFHQHNNQFLAALQNGKGLAVSHNRGDNWSLVEFDNASDIQNDEIGFILNMEQNPHSSNLELWVSSYSGLFKITESHISGRYHCVEVSASGLPNKFTGWERIGDPVGAKTMLDSITYSSPPSALRVNFDGNAKGDYWHTRWRDSKVIPGMEYTISGKIKTEGLENSGYGGAYISVVDSQDPTKRWRTTRIKGTTENWVNVSHDFVIPQGTTEVRIVLRRLPTKPLTGKVWFDDIKLYPKGEGKMKNLLITDHGLTDYSTFHGDTPTVIHFGNVEGEIIASSGLHGIYKSVDGGQSFESSNNGILLAALGKKRINLNGSRADRDLLLAAFNKHGLSSYITRNGGNTWQTIDKDNLTNGYLLDDMHPFDNKHVNYFATPTGFHPKYPATLIHAFNSSVIYKSIDRGHNWHYSGEGYSGARAGGGFSFGGKNTPRTSHLFLTDYGPVVTHDGGRTWKRIVPPRNKSHNASTGAVSPNDNNTLFAAIGSWGHDGSQVIVKTDDGGMSWEEDLTGTQQSRKYKFMAIDPTNESVIYVDNYMSIDQGDNWRLLNKTVIALSPTTGAIYAKEQGTTPNHTRILRSRDGGNRWVQYGNEINVPPKQIAEIAISPKRDGNIYAIAHHSGVYILQYKTSTWKLKNEAHGITKDSFDRYHIKHITIDPINPDVIYIGKNGSYRGHSDGVLVSTDAGNTWTNISNNLTKYSTVWDMEVNPNNEALYLATSHGTWAISPLIINYHFDEADYDTVVHNDSIHGISTESDEVGDAIRGTGTSITHGVSGTALRLDGSVDAFVALSSYTSALSDLSTNFTVEATVWFDDADTLQNGPIVSDTNSYNDPDGFLLRTWYKRLSFTVVGGSNERLVVKSKNKLESGKWYHVVGTFDNGDIRIFVNGDEVGSGNASFSSVSMQTSTPLYLGMSGINSANLRGSIDEVKIYNRTLTADEISKKYDWLFH